MADSDMMAGAQELDNIEEYFCDRAETDPRHGLPPSANEEMCRWSDVDVIRGIMGFQADRIAELEVDLKASRNETQRWMRMYHKCQTVT